MSIDSKLDELRSKLKTFLVQYFGNYEPQDDENLFASGRINSLVAMQLVLFVEREIGTRVDNDDLNLENFSSIQAILQLIERKLVSLSSED